MADEKCKAAKEYLLQVKMCDTQINNKLEELSHLKGMALKITATWKQDVTFGGSGSQDKLGDAVSAIVDLEKEINVAVDQWIDKKREVSATIERLQDPEQLRVLHLLYFGIYDPDSGKGVKYLDWEEIAAEMHVAARTAQRIHGRALQALATILESENETNNEET